MKNYLMRRYKELSKKERKGFTLVELLVVIAILAVLASVSVVGYLGFTEKARVSDDNTELHQIGTLVQAELIDGEEKILVEDGSHSTHSDTSGTSCTAYYVDFKYSDDKVTAEKLKVFNNQSAVSTVTADEIKAAIIVLVSAEDATMAKKIQGAKVENGVLTITYKNHASSESTWTLGTAPAAE